MLKKLISNKSGAGYIFIYSLAFLFILGLLYIVFLYVFEGHLIPIINQIAVNTLSESDPGAVTTIQEGIAKYMTFFKIMPFVLFGVVIIYMIASTLYKQTTGGV